MQSQSSSTNQSSSQTEAAARSHPNSSSTSSSSPCPYWEKCQRFVAQRIGLEEPIFDPEHHCCFCIACRKTRREEAILTGQRGGETYVIPIGWCKFAIPISRLDSHRGALEWPVAFHGTSPMAAHSIFMSGGELLYFGDKLPDGTTLGVVEGHYDVDRAPYVYASPSIRYCASPVYCKPAEFEGEMFIVALQVRIKPGSYSVIPETILPPSEKLHVQIDPLVPNERLEWRTDRRKVVVVSGLMVRAVRSVEKRNRFLENCVLELKAKLERMNVELEAARMERKRKEREKRAHQRRKARIRSKHADGGIGGAGGESDEGFNPFANAAALAEMEVADPATPPSHPSSGEGGRIDDEEAEQVEAAPSQRRCDDLASLDHDALLHLIIQHSSPLTDQRGDAAARLEELVSRVVDLASRRRILPDAVENETLLLRCVWEVAKISPAEKRYLVEHDAIFHVCGVLKQNIDHLIRRELANGAMRAIFYLCRSCKNRSGDPCQESTIQDKALLSSISMPKSSQDAIFNHPFLLKILTKGLDLIELERFVVHWSWNSLQGSEYFARFAVMNLSRTMTPRSTQQVGLDKRLLQLFSKLVAIDDAMRPDRCCILSNLFMDQALTQIKLMEASFRNAKFIATLASKWPMMREQLRKRRNDLQRICDTHGWNLKFPEGRRRKKTSD